jgi:hypothetical protein
MPRIKSGKRKKIFRSIEQLRKEFFPKDLKERELNKKIDLLIEKRTQKVNEIIDYYNKRIIKLMNKLKNGN